MKLQKAIFAAFDTSDCTGWIHDVYLHHSKKIKQTIYHKVMVDHGVLCFLFNNSPKCVLGTLLYSCKGQLKLGQCAVAVHNGVETGKNWYQLT